MELLDLTTHDPEEFEGKVVIYNGCEYVIGAYVGAGGYQIVHKLINKRSGEDLHVIKIWRDTSNITDQVIIETLKSSAELKSYGINIPVTVVVKAHGGYFMLQEQIISAGQATTDSIDLMLDRANQQKNSSNIEAAISSYREILKINSFHTITLFKLARIQAELRNFEEAYSLMSQVIDIEPNYLTFRGSYLEYQATCGQLFGSLLYFDRMRHDFPYEYEYYELGIRINLECGRPEKAKELSGEEYFGKTAKEDLKNEIEAALSAKQHAISIANKAKEIIVSGDTLNPQVCSLLEEAYSLYDKSPLLSINLGLALQRTGDFKRSKPLLLSVLGKMHPMLMKVCLANAAFGEIMASNFDEGVNLLGATMAVLYSDNSGNEPDDLSDLPGIALWLDEQSILEMKVDSDLLDLIERSMENCSKPESVTSNAKHLAALYEKAIGNLSPLSNL